MKTTRFAAKVLCAILVMFMAGDVTGWGQTASTTDAEGALHKRVAEFYALMKVKRTADAEKYVTSDTLDQFRLMPAGDFVGAEVASIDIAADQKSAAVMINLLVSSATIPVPFTFPRKTTWRIESNVWKIAIPTQTIESAGAGVMFPGANKPVAPPKTDLEFSNASVELTSIREGEKKLVRFQFANTSNHPVAITDMLTDCKCIALKSEKKTYKPGEKGEVAVEFDSAGLRYRYSQSVKVITSPGNQEVMLNLSADISPAY